MNVFNVVRRKAAMPNPPVMDILEEHLDQQNRIRLGGTSVETLTQIDTNPDDEPITEKVGPIGRSGNDWTYPDFPNDSFILNTDTGKRLQDFANTHLSEGPTPGRINRKWNNRATGKSGRSVSGNPIGDIGAGITVTGNSAGGIGDMMYVPHTPVPRNSIVARPYFRSVDDAAAIPAVYVADASRL